MDIESLAWPMLIVAGLLEPTWVYTMEKSEGFRNIKWSALTILVLVVDIYLLSIAMQSIGAGISYAIWTGIGAVFTFIMGIVIYKEPVKLIRFAMIGMIIVGIVGLNLSSGGM